MATKKHTVEIILNAQEKASAAIGKVTGALGGLTLAAGAVAVAAVAGLGAAAIGMANDMDAATNAIIIGTGASGKSLEDMEDAVKSLRKTSAGLNVELGDMGKVVAEVNTRTGATGKALEKFSGELLNYSRLTGGDAVDNTRLVTRVMGDWGVEMDDSSALLDQLFGAGQAFGIGVDDLAGKVVQFGAPLRQMGFSLEESIALFGKWEKEGVNAELAIGSLRIAAGKFAKDNVPLQEGLQQTMDAIKGAATESEALAIAMDVFGARAGPDMAAAIREGRFELDGAIEALQATSGGFQDAADRALTFSEKFAIIKNEAMIALEPLGESLLGLAEGAMPLLQEAITWFAEVGAPAITEFANTSIAWFDELSARSVPIIEEWRAGFDTLQPAMLMIEDSWNRISVALGLAESDFSAMDAVLGALKITLGAIETAVQLVALVMRDIATVIERVSDAIRTGISLWDQMGQIIALTGDKLPDWMKPGSPPPLYYALQDIGGAIKSLPDMGDALGFNGMGGGMAAAGAGGMGGGMMNISVSIGSVTEGSAYAAGQLAGAGVADELRRQGVQV